MYKPKSQPHGFKYIFKKKLFSFLYPNEVRNALMLKKKQFVFYKLIFSKKKKLTQSNFYSINKLKKLFKYHQLKLTFNKQYDFSSKIFPLDKFKNTNNSNSQSFSYFTNEVSEVTNKESFDFKGMSNNFKLSEVKIPRIRFKPGYQRL
jgi:hypothetical protein